MITQKLSLTCDRLLSHQQELACCHSYCGIPFQGKDVIIYSNLDPQQKVCYLDYVKCEQRNPIIIKLS